MVSGRTEIVMGEPGPGAPGTLRAIEAPQRRADDHLAAEVAGLALDLALEQVGGTQHAGHEDVDWAVIQLVGRSGLDDPAQVHHREGVGQRQRLVRIVGQGQRREAGLAMDLLQLVPAFLARPRVERAERRIEDQELGLGHQGPRQGRAQPLMRRQLLGTAPGQAVDPQGRQGLGDPALALCARAPLDLERIAHVLVDGEARPEPEVFEHHADAPLARGQRLDHPVVEEDLAVVGPLQARHQPGQGRLARPRRAENISHLPRAQLDRGAVDHRDPVITLHQTFEDDSSHF